MDPLGRDGTNDGDVEHRGARHGRPRGSWTPMSSASQDVQMLRRPHQSGTGLGIAGSMEARNAEQGKSDKCQEDIIKNSTLSVHAAEFVPKSYPVDRPSQQHHRQQQQRQQHHQQHRQQVPGRYMNKHSIQDRLQLARELPNHIQVMQSQYYAHNYNTAQQYVRTERQQFKDFPQQHQMDQHINTQDYGYYDGGAGDYKDRHQQSGGDKENSILDFANTTQQLLNVIHSLILNPGCFTLIVPPLIENLRPYLELPSQLREIIEIIIQQSINEGNFRYSGARLCTSLDNVVAPNEQASFREILYILCKEETENQATNWQQKTDNGEDDQKKCHGLILFLAELVTQMENTPAFDLGELLVRLITVVLKKPAPNSVKHICQALKLAGQCLEKDAKGSHKEMENMMRALTELVTEGRVDSHVGRMVHSVRELRNGNWGQGTSNVETTTETNQIIEPPDTLNEPVLYGPDGEILSAEEHQFLEDVADSAGSIESDVSLGYKDGGKMLSEDEDEMDAAYEEFLKLIPKKIENKAQE